MSSKPSMQLANVLGPSSQALASQESVAWARMAQRERGPREPRHPTLSHLTLHKVQGQGWSGDHRSEQQELCFSSALVVVYYLGAGLRWANFLPKAPRLVHSEAITLPEARNSSRVPSVLL